MKYFVFSDVHEDYKSLKNVYKFIVSENITDYKTVSLGDNIGFSSHYYLQDCMNRNANACINLLKQNKTISVVGNHDLNFLNKQPINSFSLFPQNNLKNKKNDKVWLYQDELKTNIKESNINYLDQLNEFFIDSEIIFSHFLYPDLTGNVILTKETLRLFIKTHFIFMSLNQLKLSFIGHTHTKNPIIVSDKGEEFRLSSNDEIKLNLSEGSYIILCPPLLSYHLKRSSFVSYCNISSVLKYYNLGLI